MNEFIHRPSVDALFNAVGLYLMQLMAWLSSVMPDVLLATRGVCHLSIFLLVVGYKAPTSNHRKVIGIVAGIFAGANAAEAYRIAYNFTTFSSFVQPPLTLVMVCVLFFVAYAKGNMAAMLPGRLVRFIK